MIRKFLCCILCLVFTFLLSGCWSYIGLDEISMASGLAVDKDEQSNRFKLAIEMVDLSASTKEKGPSTKIIESEGITIFDAVRNAKKKLSNKLYFGHAKIIVLSEDIAKEEDLINLVDLFIRDKEMRENIYVVISQEKTASDILKVQGTDQSNVSLELNNIVSNDSKVTASTAPLELYGIYNILNYPGISATLPAFHNVDSEKEKKNEQQDKSKSQEKDQEQSEEKKNSELNGTAVFKDQRLVGYLTPEESKYFLFIIDGIKGGVLPISTSENQDIDSSLEVFKSKTKLSYKNKKGELTIHIKINTKVVLGEVTEMSIQLNEEDIKKMEQKSSELLKKQMQNLIKKVQKEYNSDIFGFGNMIYRKNPKLWAQLSDEWDNIFPTLEVEIEPKVEIINTALKKI